MEATFLPDDHQISAETWPVWAVQYLFIINLSIHPVGQFGTEQSQLSDRNADFSSENSEEVEG